jgi:hypothetical protein
MNSNATVPSDIHANNTHTQASRSECSLINNMSQRDILTKLRAP